MASPGAFSLVTLGILIGTKPIRSYVGIVGVVLSYVDELFVVGGMYSALWLRENTCWFCEDWGGCGRAAVQMEVYRLGIAALLAMQQPCSHAPYDHARGFQAGPPYPRYEINAFVCNTALLQTPNPLIPRKYPQN